jgi:hypothetical protein
MGSLNFDDEAQSRRRFVVRTLLFWRRGQFSSPFLVWEVSILTMRLNLVAVLWWKIRFFDDEAQSRRRFVVENSIF